VDANFVTARVDLWANMLDGLPFRDRSVDLIYSHHVIEHLPDAYLPRLFEEMFRVLRPRGGIRLCAPHLGNACRKYVAGDREWFSDFPTKRESIGGRFTNYIFCKGEHLTALDESYLGELAASAGFEDISACLPVKETRLGDVGLDAAVLSKEWESDFSCPHTVVIEARKPLA
jgi:predicted SAM-dependent methyltransferase